LGLPIFDVVTQDVLDRVVVRAGGCNRVDDAQGKTVRITVGSEPQVGVAEIAIAALCEKVNPITVVAGMLSPLF